MKPTLTVGSGSGSYPCYLGSGLLARVGEVVRAVSGGRRPILITSPLVGHLFADRVRRSFDVPVPTILMDDGESSKTFGTVERLVGDLLEMGARRDTVVIALGGGVVGDTAGFASAIFLRGVDLVHVPTTLLAQVDSSIGGKVAVNHERGKNLAGSFHPPKAVIADPATLATLPSAELRSGVFEALKAGVIGSVSLFEIIENSFDAVSAMDPGTLETVIRKAVEVKAAIVSADEREGDVRRLLNYGHTIAHGLEAALGYAGLTHGEAVAWGMIGANAVACRRGLLDDDLRDRIDNAILGCGPRPIPPVDEAAVRAAIDHDKKFTSGKRVMVLPRGLARPEIVEDVLEEEIELALAAALKASSLTRPGGAEA